MWKDPPALVKARLKESEVDYAQLNEGVYGGGGRNNDISLLLTAESGEVRDASVKTRCVDEARRSVAGWCDRPRLLDMACCT